MDPVVLLLMVGLPLSGKSTWAREYGAPIVSPDAIRLALHGARFIPESEAFVWAIAHVMVRALFLAGHPTVVLDATNTSRKRRDEWKRGPWDRMYQVIDTPKEICLERARAAGDEEIISVIERMASRYEPVAEDER